MKSPKICFNLDWFEIWTPVSNACQCCIKSVCTQIACHLVKWATGPSVYIKARMMNRLRSSQSQHCVLKWRSKESRQVLLIFWRWWADGIKLLAWNPRERMGWRDHKNRQANRDGDRQLFNIIWSVVYSGHSKKNNGFYLWRNMRNACLCGIPMKMPCVETSNWICTVPSHIEAETKRPQTISVYILLN